MKKLISVMLVLCMVLALVPAMAFAAVSDTDVAQISGVGYKTLQAAVDAAKAGDHIDVVADITDFTLVIDKDLTIKLGGHTMTAKETWEPSVVVNAGSTVTFQGPGKIVGATGKQADKILYMTGNVVIDGGTYAGYIVNKGTLTVNAGTFEGTLENAGNVTVKSGTFTTGYAVEPLVKNAKGATFTVEDGEFETTGIIFENKGTVTLQEGLYTGKLHDHNKDTGTLTVEAGSYSDKDVTKHTKAPIAGWHENFTPATNDATYYWVSQGTASYWLKYFGTYAPTTKGDVYFLSGNMVLDGVPEQPDYQIYYYENGGTATVNSRIYFNVIAVRAVKNGIANQGNNAAEYYHVQKNLAAVTAVSAAETSRKDTTYGNHMVYGVIDITADLTQMAKYVAAYDLHGYDSDDHAWYPLIVGVTDLNKFGQIDNAEVTLVGGIRSIASVVVPSKDFATWSNAKAYGFAPDQSTYPGLDGETVTYFITWIPLEESNGATLSFDVDIDRNGEHYADTYNYTIRINGASTAPDGDKYPDAGAGSAPSTPPATSGTGAGEGPAKTGDNSTVMLWATLLVASAAGVAICVVDEAKKRSRK